MRQNFWEFGFSGFFGGPEPDDLEGVKVGLVLVGIGAFGGESFVLDSDGDVTLEGDNVVLSSYILGD